MSYRAALECLDSKGKGTSMMKKTTILRTLGFAGLASITALVMSCGEESTSSLEHNHGEPTRSANPLLWFSAEENPYESYQASQKGNFNVLDKTEAPLVRAWAQNWIDVMDAQLRSRYPDQLRNTPKPEVALIGTENPNAFINSSPYCFTTSVDIEPAAGQGNGVLYLSDGGPVVFSEKTLSDARIDCKPISSEAMQEYFNYFNANTKSDCRLSKKGGSSYRLSGCKPQDGEPELGVLARASKVLLFRVHPYVNLNLGLISLMNDSDEYISIIAHELGHYYRSHSNKVDGEYDYFYTLYQGSDRGVKPEPTRDERVVALGESVQIAAQAYDGVNRLSPKVPGTTIDPINFFAAGNLAKLVCDQPVTQQSQCSKACRKVADVSLEANKQANSDNLGYYPYGRSYNEAFIKSLDAQMLACIEPLKDVTVQNPGVVRTLYTAGVWNPHVASKGIVLRKSAGIAAVASTIEFDASDDLFAVFDKVNGSIDSVNEKVAQNYREAFDMRLGWYTAEQEADDFAAELLYYLNLDTKAGAKAFLSIQKDVSRQLDDNDTDLSFGFSRCSALFQADWKDANGQEVVVPVGDFVDDHHSNCYRAFNISREVEAHDYVPDESNRTISPVAEYSEVRQASETYLANMSSSFVENDNVTAAFDLKTLERSAIQKLVDKHHIDCRFSGRH